MMNTKISLEKINDFNKNTLISHLGIEITKVKSHSLEGIMPVDTRTHQPMGLLHGGASVVLMESLGSLGSSLCVNLDEQHIVGLEINANHIKSLKSGNVKGIATIIHQGKTTHIWDIKVINKEEALISTGRLTVLVKNNI